MTPSIHRPVVVGVSGDQPDLLQYAAAMAEMVKARLRVVHAHSFQVGTADLYIGRDVGIILHDAAERVLDEAQRRLADHPTLDVEYVLRTEPPAFAIETESEEASLVVMGADDVALFDRVAGGEVARRAAVHSACPVLVVPVGVDAPDTREIVVGIDTENVVEGALGFAFGFAARTGAAVRVFTVLPSKMPPEQRARHEGRLRGLVAHWNHDFPQVDARAGALTGDASEELARHARDAQLVVVGHPNQPHRAPFFSRRVAASLVRTAPCVVTIVPEGCDDVADRLKR